MNADQYNNINSLLSQYSSLSAALEIAEAEIKTVQLEAAKDLLPKHAAAKIALADLETTLRKLSDRHYTELFPEEKRSHKTPFGEIQYRKSSSLAVADEEKAILKIKLACQDELARESAEGKAPRFTLDAGVLYDTSKPHIEPTSGGRRASSSSRHAAIVG